jgi:hypothetical protein
MLGKVYVNVKSFTIEATVKIPLYTGSPEPETTIEEFCVSLCGYLVVPVAVVPAENSVSNCTGGLKLIARDV